MPIPTLGDGRRGRSDALRAEAAQAVGYSVTQLHALAERVRTLYRETLEEWTRRREELAALPPGSDAEARRASLRTEIEWLGAEAVGHRAELERLEVARRAVETSLRALGATGDGAAPLPAHPHDETVENAVATRVLEAQEQERGRLARDLHDGPTHAVANAVFQAEFVGRLLDRDPGQAQAELARLNGVLQRAVGELRGFITQLRPPELEALGLETALRDHVANLANAPGPMIELELRAPSDALSEAQRITAFRVAQEAIRNARKHAAAGTIRVETRAEEAREVMSGNPADVTGDEPRGAWVLEIHDDGQGFDVQDAMSGRPGHFGLRFMQERADLVGARLEVVSGRRAGTTVRLTIAGAEGS